MKQLSTGQLLLIYEALNLELREFLSSDEFNFKIKEVAQDFNLDLNQETILGFELVDVVMGVIPREQLGSEIAKSLGIDQPKAEQIAQKIEERILSGIELPEVGIIPEPEIQEEIDRDRLPKIKMGDLMKQAPETPKPFQPIKKIIQPASSQITFGVSRTIPPPPTPPTKSEVFFPKPSAPAFPQEKIGPIKYQRPSPPEPLDSARSKSFTPTQSFSRTETKIPVPPPPPPVAKSAPELESVIPEIPQVPKIPEPPQPPTKSEEEVIDLSQL